MRQNWPCMPTSSAPVLTETLYARLNSLVADNPLVYGAAIAFEPFAYQEYTRLF